MSGQDNHKMGSEGENPSSESSNVNVFPLLGEKGMSAKGKLFNEAIKKHLLSHGFIEFPVSETTDWDIIVKVFKNVVVPMDDCLLIPPFKETVKLDDNNDSEGERGTSKGN